jgi:Tol biopolymer transport system component
MRRLLLIALAALLVAGCGGSSAPKGPPALLFVSTKDGDYAIFGADADGGHAHRLTKEKGDPSSPAGLFFQIEPAWSPDGKQIAFVSGRDGVGHVFVMKPDGTGTRRVTNTRKDDAHPSWSPDGKWLVFSREGALFRAPVEGGAAQRLLRKAPGHAADPAYSPDGKQVAYDYRRPGFSIREVYVMNADGTGSPRQLTDLREVSGFPSWSPDGKELAFMSDAHGGHTEIYTIPANGGRPKRVTISGTDAIQPAWSPDGTLGFSRDGAIWKTDGKKDTKLTSGDDNDSAPAWNPHPPK